MQVVVCSLINVIQFFFCEVEQVVLLNMHSLSGSKKMDKTKYTSHSMEAFICHVIGIDFHGRGHNGRL